MEFDVTVGPTDKEGVEYVEIRARRTYTDVGDLHRWLLACVYRLDYDLRQ